MTSTATCLVRAAFGKRASVFLINSQFTATVSLTSNTPTTPLRWKSTLTSRPTRAAFSVPFLASSTNTTIPLFSKSLSSSAISKNSSGSMLWPATGGATSGSSRFQPTGTRAQQPTSQQQLQQQLKGNNDRMDWNTYFALRKTRRNYENVFMVPSSMLSFSGAGFYFLLQPFDPTPIFGYDQLLVYGVGTVAMGIFGVAAGRVIGNMVFRVTHSQVRPLVDVMDKEFHKHIVKYRVDPTRNSGRNVVPDYYGEKINSLSDYRRWMRKQREFRRKADGLK
ncbi:TIM23 complex component [Gryganskiella cystojenkinii]|nr:TIM23 complex component [Gryganskiella cystojenkinii]